MNIDQAHNSAKAFLIAFSRCMELRPKKDGEFERLAVPGIVCAAFSAELGLKALLLASGKNVKGHNLQTLFEELDEATQKKIISASGIAGPPFRSSLAASANVFDEWRYVHEKSGLNAFPAFLGTLAQSIQSVFAP